MADDKPQIDPEAPATEDEIRESERLRDALASGEDHALADLARAAAQAAAPADLDAAELDALVRAAIDAESLVPNATEDEARDAEELRAALEDDDRDHALADLARAVVAAHAPASLSAEENARLVARALAPATTTAKPSRGNVIRVAFGAVATVTALAASVWIFLGPPGAAPATADLARARSTQPLFDEPFRAGAEGGSARIDRIAVARATDFRENRFKRWGVR